MKKLLFADVDDTGRARLRTFLFAALLLPLVLALGACDALEDAGLTRGDNVQIGMIESSGFNNARARFHTLTGRKAWRESVDAGDTLVLDVEAAVEKGTLTLQVESPQHDVIWEKVVVNGEPVDGEIELMSAASGTYTIVVVGEDAGGSYDLSWEQQE